eukprot:TRINITY_DN4802_c1_g1_i1.p1 TRINITY_DN4802_c1_g1~~TRINITY_DN4802_c1_g1_i1.p1  ORF type:complete len:407 (+),score=113.89 TRINITY_DN4802_c1_g1_i1:63-1283(+)
MGKLMRCPVCRECMREELTASHRCPKEAMESEYDFSRTLKVGGLLWRSGMRVVTKCGLAGMDKKEYEAGQTGCVWEVLDDGVLFVCLDDPECAIKLAKAEPKDLVVEHFLPPKTKVRAHELELSLGDRRKVIPNKEFGEVVSFNSEENVYMVRFTALKLLANVPSYVVQPLPRKKSLMERLSSLADATKQRAASSKSRGPAGLTINTGAHNGNSTQNLTAVQSSNASFMSGLSDSDEDPGLSTSISNLAKVPAYSNISGSPRALKTSMRGSRLCSPLNLNASVSSGVSWGEYEDQDRGPEPLSPRDLEDSLNDHVSFNTSVSSHAGGALNTTTTLPVGLAPATPRGTSQHQGKGPALQTLTRSSPHRTQKRAGGHSLVSLADRSAMDAARRTAAATPRDDALPARP